jgi:signal transduction histidine kinase
MKIRLVHKLSALLLVSGVVPLVAISLLLIGIGRRQVESTVQQVHLLEANAAATAVSSFLQQCERRMTADLEGSVDAMVDEEVRKALIWMIGKPDNIVRFRILRIHDAEGLPISDPVRLPAESIPEEHHASYLVTDTDVAEFSRHVPLDAALESGDVQISEPYVSARRREALLAMAVPLRDQLRELRWVVTAEVSLRDVQRLVSDVTVGNVGYAYLVDSHGHAIAHPEFDRVRERATLTGNGIVEKALSARQPAAHGFVTPDGTALLGAHAPVFWGGWQLIVQQPEADAYAPVREMQLRALYILAGVLVASVALGALYVRSLVRPLRQVMDGMRRIVDGHFGHRLDVKTQDEVGELADAFNVMGRMLQKYKSEIEAWNQELQGRVDSKTRQLESAQAQLVKSAKLSAVGQLGAGVAHELNNPLAGVVGQAALLRRRLKKASIPDEERERLDAYVQHIENESGRCREIIHALLSFSQSAGAGRDHLDVSGSLEKLLVLWQSNARAAGIVVKQDLARDLPLVSVNEQQVQQVVMHVLANAQQAMPDGGTVTVTTRRCDEGVAICITDTGRGIPKEHLDKIFDPFFTTKDNWQSPGLGLSVCYSIVETHGGRIEVDSEIGRGTTFRIVFPKVGTGESRRRPTEEPVGLRRGRPVPAGA